MAWYLESFLLRHFIFLYKVCKALLAEFNVVLPHFHSVAPPNHGLTKRFKCFLGDNLSIHTLSDHSNWDQVLLFITYACITATQTTTGFSPFHLHYERQPTCTLDTVLHNALTPLSAHCFPRSRNFPSNAVSSLVHLLVNTRSYRNLTMSRPGHYTNSRWAPFFGFRCHVRLHVYLRSSQQNTTILICYQKHFAS